MRIVSIVGTRSEKGQTGRAAEAYVAGATAAGAKVEEFYLPKMKIERCRQCEDNGWGKCRTEGYCVIEDDFAGLVEKVRAAEGVVFSNPVYFGDLSESLRAFLDRLRRITRHDAGKAGITDKGAVGICVAGGGGGGAPHCTVILERTLATCGFDVVDVIPVRRQNLDMKLDILKTCGKWFAGKPSSKGA